jgi:hypothetical protein
MSNSTGSIDVEHTRVEEQAVMLDHIMQCVHAFEREQGISPDVVYINPFHYEALRRYHPGLFNTGESSPLGFRLVIVPANLLPHPEAALLKGALYGSHVA